MLQALATNSNRYAGTQYARLLNDYDAIHRAFDAIMKSTEQILGQKMFVADYRHTPAGHAYSK